MKLVMALTVLGIMIISGLVSVGLFLFQVGVFG